MSKITIQINADDAADMTTILTELAEALSGRIDVVRAEGGAVQLDVETEAPKRKRGRPRKEPASEPDEKPIQDEVEDDEILRTAAEVRDEYMASAADTAPPVEIPGTVKDMSPEDARGEAIRKMQQHFSANPGCMPDVDKILKKFGVKKFQDVPDEHAHALLADVLLLVSGTKEAA